ncbi:MAG: sensor histidine kinase, partial [Comamonadaceae bacterium]
AVYRTPQESLTNAVRHAGCARIEIALSDRSGCLTLEVADDGRGLPPDAWTRAGAFGLAGLRERASAVGGWLDVASRPQGGTLVALAIPLDIHPSTGPQELSS